MARHTTQELAHQIKELDGKVDDGFKEVRQELKEVDRRFERMTEIATKTRHEFRNKLMTVYTFMDRQTGFNEGYEKAKSDASLKSQIKSGDIRISKEAWWLIVKIVGFVGTGLAIIGVLINA